MTGRLTPQHADDAYSRIPDDTRTSLNGLWAHGVEDWRKGSSSLARFRKQEKMLLYDRLSLIVADTLKLYVLFAMWKRAGVDLTSSPPLVPASFLIDAESAIRCWEYDIGLTL